MEKEVQSCALLAHILRFGERSTILRSSCAYIVHWRKKYNLVQILHIYSHRGNKYNLVQILRIHCTLEKEVQSCANLAHILHIGERNTVLHKSCTYIAHWGEKYNLAHWRKKYNLAQILCIYCTSGKVNLTHISHIVRESCANLAHILRIDTSNVQLAHLAQNTISPCSKELLVNDDDPRTFEEILNRQESIVFPIETP